MTQKFLMSVSDEMHAELEAERQKRKLETIQEVVRQILSDAIRGR
jgi:hypothetical protein